MSIIFELNTVIDDIIIIYYYRMYFIAEADVGHKTLEGMKLLEAIGTKLHNTKAEFFTDSHISFCLQYSVEIVHNKLHVVKHDTELLLRRKLY